MERVPFTSLLEAIVDNRGRTCPVVETGLPLIATNCVKSNTLYPVFEKVRYVSDETYKTWFRGHPLPGDMIFVTKGSPGEVCWTPDPVTFCIAQDMVAVRADKSKVYPKYLFAALRSPSVKHDIDNMHVGSLIPHFKKGDFDKLYIPVLDRASQVAIGDMHFSICEKIELNRRTNETLEAMARALFKDWFVDFGPTRAKVEGRAPYLAPDLWSLFPDRLNEETGLPERWDYSTVGERFDVRIGRTPPRKEAWHFTDGSEGVPWLSIRDLGDCGVYVNDTSEGLAEKSVADFRVPVVNAGTVLVSFKLTVGRVAIADRAMATNEAIAHLNAIERSSSAYFTYCWMSGFDYSRLGSTSSIATAVNSQTIKEMPFPDFGSDLEERFALLVEPLFQKIRESTLESRTLAQTRDLLLPKLMSGEIRLRDVEGAV